MYYSLLAKRSLENTVLEQMRRVWYLSSRLRVDVPSALVDALPAL